MKIKIIYEDASILIIYKPAGLATQSARVTQPDVVSEACSYIKTTYVGLVHRLDQPVEGLLALAKTKEAAANLTKQLADGSLQKRYYAMCLCPDKQSKPDEDLKAKNKGLEQTELTDYLLKNAKTGRAEIVTGLAEQKRPKEAKEARLTYRLIQCKALEDYTQTAEEKQQLALADIELMTGRFHQIRAQMANAGFPLLGDSKYGTDESIRVSEKLGVRNVALCAYALSLIHPKTGRKLEFTVKPENPVFEL